MLPFDPNGFKADLKSKGACNDELAEQLPEDTAQLAIRKNDNLIDKKVQDLASLIDEGTDDMGVMLYFGDL